MQSQNEKEKTLVNYKMSSNYMKIAFLLLAWNFDLYSRSLCLLEPITQNSSQGEISLYYGLLEIPVVMRLRIFINSSSQSPFISGANVTAIKLVNVQVDLRFVFWFANHIEIHPRLVFAFCWLFLLAVYWSAWVVNAEVVAISYLVIILTINTRNQR